ncbi:dihydrodipicolinate synthase family protein [Halorarum halobium]|uniref:dihydrodipicolinate synthase family protein n=1 Tax=Halorarum halobium TaxID=3075121 RepID=UPI0028A72823|nr:dihydrodipicolinate synthase family protein [Halobaculum sp. XH14]
MNPFDTPGLLVPPMTPFAAGGDVDHEAYEEQIEYVLANCDPAAIPLLAVEAQEYRALSPAERAETVRRGAEIVDGRVPVIVGASAASPRRAIEFGRIATEVDADAVQLLIPRRLQGGATRVEELAAFFAEVGDALDLPIVAYHNPGPGASLTPDELVRLARVDAVAAFKESSRNARRVLTLIERIDRAGLANYYTTMELLLVTVLMGGSGGTMPAPPAVIASDLLAALADGDLEGALDRQRAFAEFPAGFLEHGFPAVMKAALAHVGVDAGVPLSPAGPLPAEVRARLADRLDAVGLAAHSASDRR